MTYTKQSLSVATALEKNRLDSDVPFLVAIDIEVVNPATAVVVEVLHFVLNSEEITFNGVVYQPAIFDVKFSNEAGAQSTVDLTVKDLTGAVQARMEEYGGGVGFNVTMYVLNAGALDEEPEVVEFFQVTGSSAADYHCHFRLGAENEVMKTFPRRRQTKDFCQWRYKDPVTCRYTGGLATCDLTLQGANGCAAHNNTINFGAYPGLNSNGMRYA
jgi:phage-related protein